MKIRNLPYYTKIIFTVPIKTVDIENSIYHLSKEEYYKLLHGEEQVSKNLLKFLEPIHLGQSKRYYVFLVRKQKSVFKKLTLRTIKNLLSTRSFSIQEYSKSEFRYYCNKYREDIRDYKLLPQKEKELLKELLRYVVTIEEFTKKNSISYTRLLLSIYKGLL